MNDFFIEANKLFFPTERHVWPSIAVCQHGGLHGYSVSYHPPLIAAGRRWSNAASAADILAGSYATDSRLLVAISKSSRRSAQHRVRPTTKLQGHNALNLNFTESDLKFKVTDSDDNGYQVPNIVHYIWHSAKPAPLRFDHMIGVLSSHKTIRPDVIYFHTSNEPTGPYWQALKQLPGLKVVQRAPPTHVFGEKLPEPFYYTSHSNVDRLLVLMEYGGIYLDLDVIVTSSFDELRRHAYVIGACVLYLLIGLQEVRG